MLHTPAVIRWPRQCAMGVDRCSRSRTIKFSHDCRIGITAHTEDVGGDSDARFTTASAPRT